MGRRKDDSERKPNPCPPCAGTGRVAGDGGPAKCPDCGGTGYGPLTPAQQKLVEDNLALVHHLFGRSRWRSWRWLADDLIRAGYEGLCKAAQRYDEGHVSERTGGPVKFCTYAGAWIIQSFQVEAARLQGAGPVPRGYERTPDHAAQAEAFSKPCGRLTELLPDRGYATRAEEAAALASIRAEIDDAIATLAKAWPPRREECVRAHVARLIDGGPSEVRDLMKRFGVSKSAIQAHIKYGMAALAKLMRFRRNRRVA